MDKKTLPEKFEEFSDARREGFIEVMNIKESGGMIAGVFCAYTPLEVIEAANFVPVGLCGTSPETIPDAETVLPKNLCPLIKSSYGFALTDKCPYFYFSDVIIGETTCDGKKKMYELLEDLGKNVYMMHLPQGADRDYEIDFWEKEIHRLLDYFETKFNRKITKEQLNAAIKKTNRQRKLRVNFFELQKLVPPPMTGTELIKTAEGDEFRLDPITRQMALEELIQYILDEYHKGNQIIGKDKRRIMLTGCPMGGVIDKIGPIIEDSGGVIVCYDTCAGSRTSGIMVEEDTDDPVRALAERYLKISCSVMTPNQDRLDFMEELIDEYQVEAVIEVVLQACHTFNIEAVKVRRLMQEKGIPYMQLETDYSESDIGQISTRIQAFLEMI